MQYTSLDQFLSDLPAHAARHRQELMGHDNLFLIQTKEGRSLYVRLLAGNVILSEQETQPPVCTISAAESTILDLVNGRLNPAKALLLRKITVRGNAAALMGLIGLVK